METTRRRKVTAAFTAASVITLAFAAAAVASAGAFYAGLPLVLAIVALVMSLQEPHPRSWPSWIMLVVAVIVATLSALYFALGVIQ